MCFHICLYQILLIDDHFAATNLMEMALSIMRYPGIPIHNSEHHGMIAAMLVAAHKNI
jgi:hypothetical protein